MAEADTGYSQGVMKALNLPPAIPSIGDDMAAARSRETAAVGKVSEATKGREAALGDVEGRIKKQEAAAPALPKYDAIPDKFEHKGLNPEQMTEAMQTMFAFAAIGGAMTRTPMTAAMNAFTGALKGLQQGDQELFKRERETYDTNMKQAIAKNNQAAQEYQAAWDKHKNDMGTLMTEWRLIATKYNDTVSAANLEAQDARSQVQQMANLVRMGKQMEQQDERLRLMLGRQDETGRHNLEMEDAARKKGARGNQTQNRMQRVMAIDVDNAEYNFGKLADMSKERGSLIGASPTFANHFGGSWAADFKRYLETGAIPQDLQGADALLMNLAFDIASGQSGGSGQLAQAKIAELEKQMPLDTMPDEVKRQRYQALFHRVKAINGQLPDEMKKDLSKYESVFGEGGGAPAAGGPTISPMQDVQSILKSLGKPYEPDKFDYRVQGGQVQRKPKSQGGGEMLPSMSGIRG